MKKSIYAGIALLLIVLGGAYLFVTSKATPVVVPPQPIATSTLTLINSVTYQCQNDQSVIAEYFENATPAVQQMGERPVPSGSVHITFSDGRTLDLGQTISADGGRYANADESLIFWSKGNALTIYENSKGSDTITCIAVAQPITGILLPSIYISTSTDYSVRLPSLGTTSNDYTVDETYTHLIAPSVRSTGVKFTIPSAIASGTNLSKDSYLAIERADIAVCIGSAFSQIAGTSTLVTDQEIEYSLATSSDAGAGNRHEEMLYAFPGTSPCMAIRYFIHYTVLENYPAGTVRAFDEQALLTTFDHIRQSLTR